jgi:F-type H+-transporting ATPase subunit b
MDIITPGIGLIFWTVFIFVILLVILKMFAWKPILNAVRTREESIMSALKSADRAKAEMLALQADNEKILLEARLERDALIKEAREVKDKIMEEARIKAGDEAKSLIDMARMNIQNEKNSAIDEIKEHVAKLSVEIAEKILKQTLSSEKNQKDLIDKLLKEIKPN